MLPLRLPSDNEDRNPLKEEPRRPESESAHPTQERHQGAARATDGTALPG